MSLSEKVQNLNSEIGATVDRAIAEMRQEVSQWLRSSSEELVGRLAELRPSMPESFVAQGDLEPAVRSAAEELSSGARDSGLEEGRNAGHQAGFQEGRSEGIVEGQREGRRKGISELRDALGSLDRARSQAEILGALLRESSRWSSRSAILLLRGGEVRGWSSHGFDTTEAALREVNLGAPQEGSWSHAFQGQGPVRMTSAECAVLCSRLDSALPHDGVLVPLVLRDRVAAALYADQYDGSPVGAEALQVLCYTAALAIESLPFRERASTATLEPVHGEPAAPAPPAPPAPEAEPQAAEPEAASIASTADASVETPEEPYAAASDALPAVQEDETVSEMAEVEIEAEPEPAAYEPAADAAVAVEEEPAPWASVEEPASPYAYETAATAATMVDEEPAAETWSGPVGVVEDEEPSTPTQKVDLRTLSYDVQSEPVAASPEASNSQATVLLQRSSFREAMTPEPIAPPSSLPSIEERPMTPPTPIRPPAPPAAAPIAPPPVASGEDAPAAAAGTPEVRPPSDLQGPGWAFASNRQPVSPNEEALHEEARRLARLLVSEIKLYNEEQVEEGRRKRDVYERLREDIDRSRQMYEERVEPRILKSTDYFYQELVRILAAGDARALGI